jgi:hypothetical protein
MGWRRAGLEEAKAEEEGNVEEADTFFAGTKDRSHCALIFSLDWQHFF